MQTAFPHIIFHTVFDHIRLPYGVSIIDVCDTAHTRILWTSNNILIFICAEKNQYTPEHLQVNAEVAKRLTKGSPHRRLILVGDDCSITPEAKKELASKDDTFTNVIAEAYVVQRYSQNIEVNWYIISDHPVVPTNVFSSFEEAMLWLSEFSAPLH